MDDLNGLNWTSSTSANSTKKPPPMTQSSYSYTLKPTPPLSGRSTPLTAQDIKPSTNGLSRSSASTPANDSFANLVSFNAADPNRNLSLQERQKKLQEERARQQQEKFGSVSGRHDEELWEKLGSGRSSTEPVGAPPRYTATEEYGGHRVSKTINKPFAGIDFGQRRPSQPATDRHDLINDFDNLHVGSANRVESSKPKNGINGVGRIQEQGQSTALGSRDNIMVDDDDPFGLGSIAASSRPTVSGMRETTDGDDDLLGLLGRPVSEFVPPKESSPPPTESAKIAHTSPADRALAELVDMGFEPEKSKQALDATETGANVQAAVGWLLHQAHEESRSKSHGREPQSRRPDPRPDRTSPPRKRGAATEGAEPAWMRSTAERSTHQSRQSSRSPVNGEKDPSKIAAELGNNLFKTANSLWKTGTKKLNKAVAEMNSDSDSSQPKWMREPRVEIDGPARNHHPPQEGVTNGHETSAKPRRQTAKPEVEVTDEALMLESADARPQTRKPPRPKTEKTHEVPRPRPASPVAQSYGEKISQPRFMQQPRSQRHDDPRSRLNKQAVEEQTAEAYISPARRKKTAPKLPVPESDLLFESSQPPSQATTSPMTHRPPPRQPPSQQPNRIQQVPRPSPPQRKVPPISPSALHTSHASRRAGTVAFKLGNYAEATAHYTSALSPLPSAHPLHIPLLSNRALSHLKTGEPKACIADTQTAIDLIGPSRGVGETVDLGDEGAKAIRDYWGKAMTRQAEALEQLERWSEAGNIWKTCVEAGVGGATSIAGRNRCERAVHGPSRASSKPAAPKKPPPKPRPKPQVSALDDLTGTATHTDSADSEAVSRLRLANTALERLDDEKFALADTVSDRIFRWRSGKENNLRALLASLDTVLWEGSGWTKVGMGELILPGKVKVVYMKGIGKCHPDKLPTTAKTEQKMISAAVFATLNEAWDGFKRENGL